MNSERQQINSNAGIHHTLSRQILGIDWYDTESSARRVIEWLAEGQEPVGYVVEKRTGSLTALIGVIRASAILVDFVTDGTPLYAAPVYEVKAQGVVMPDRDAVIRKAVGMCNRIPGSTTWNAAEFAYDELADRLNAAPAADAGKLADAFLSWKLPNSVRPDGCAMDPTYQHRYGTNLMTWAQAKEMFEYVLAAHSANGSCDA